MGAVFQPIFFPRWRVRFVLIGTQWWDDGTSGPKLCAGRWWRTQADAEKHAIYFLDGLGPGDGSALYDMQCQGNESD